ncbi:MAG: hypothetical protein QOD96_4011, partial [Pseudonocardiales bacterium]|nr:hypothetical protein [Pseudonocardiales bacterium]
VQFLWMCTVTFMPGTRASPLVLVNATRTAITWVTFWKLPVLLDSGNSENWFAAAPWISETMPVTGVPENASTSMSTWAPG